MHVVNEAESAFATISETDALELPPGVLSSVVTGDTISTNSSSEAAALETRPAAVPLELFVVPTPNCRSFRVSALKFDVALDAAENAENATTSFVPLETCGRRVFATKAEVFRVLFF